MKTATLFMVASFIFTISNSKEVPNQEKKGDPLNSLSVCIPSQSSVDLDIGNVRARLLINGDMWWDLSGNAIYEVPKGSGLHALYAGALWIGGKDGGGNLKVAAQTYRQSGSDFWPGPVDTVNATVTSSVCLQYDRFWKITRQEVADFINGLAPSQQIIDWPGNGTGQQGHMLAPFFDRVGDGIYDYIDGDYPKYDFNNTFNDINQRLNGDQTIWWVFNDVGNAHGETGSLFPVGVEIRAQAFAFCTTDSTLANTTFYNYQIIHRSSTPLFETYIGHWADVDLGNYLDDYAGCDVSRDFGYGYNGDNLDDPPYGYGIQLAAVGIDILQGPLADLNDSIDNNRNGVTDEPGETINFSKFVYYNNDFTNIGNPATAQHHYNYLDGKWKDNSPLVYGGTGYQTSGAPECNFMFPGDSDPLNWGTAGIDPGFNWTEFTPLAAGPPNVPGDRRFLMSSGKMTLMPGEVKYFTKAAIWARVQSGIASSLQALMDADDKIQSFFDSNFTTIATCAVNTSVGSNANSQAISVYPSPASDFFKIVSHNVSEILEVSVYNPEGKLLCKVSGKNTDEVSVNTSGWPAGMYFLIINFSGKSVCKKIAVI